MIGLNIAICLRTATRGIEEWLSITEATDLCRILCFHGVLIAGSNLLPGSSCIGFLMACLSVGLGMSHFQNCFEKSLYLN